MSYRDNLAKDEKEYGIGNTNFKFQKGKNRIRILTEPRGYQSIYKDIKTGEEKISTKFLCYVLDRSEQLVKLAFLPYGIAKGIGELEDDELAPFNGFPMPYDITIEVEGEPGTLTVKYGAVRATKETQLTDNELFQLNSQTPIQEVRDKLHAKQSGFKKVLKLEEPDIDDIRPEEIPF